MKARVLVIIALAAITLAACAPSVGYIDLGVAGAQATIDAATVQAGQTVAAINVSQTAVSAEMTAIAGQTQAAAATISFAQTATPAAAAATVAYATQTKIEKMQTQDSFQATQEAKEEPLNHANSLEWQATARIAIMVVVAATSSVTVIIYAIRARGTAKQQDAEARIAIARAKTEAQAQATRVENTVAGVLVITPWMPPWVVPVDQAARDQHDGAVTSVMEQITDTYRLRIGGRDMGDVAKMDDTEARAIEQGRADMLALLDAARQYYEQSGIDWTHEYQIPSSHTLGWSGSRWQAARNLFGDALVSRTGQGNGTRVVNGTLGDLHRRVQHKTLMPKLPPPQRASTAIIDSIVPENNWNEQ